MAAKAMAPSRVAVAAKPGPARASASSRPVPPMIAARATPIRLSPTMNPDASMTPRSRDGSARPRASSQDSTAPITSVTVTVGGR